jgi:beta-lactamase superfamily II metal-dependent hydrolase
MSTEFKLPSKKAALFWDVGTGDSTTLVVKPGEVVAQIDIRHLEKAEDKDEPEWPVIDLLVKSLPKRNGRPYLALFVLTHPDRDHVQGFAELNRKVHIGELWHTPKIFRDLEGKEEFCEDAKAFRAEAHRRRKAILANPGNVKSGDRIRIIGHDDVLKDEKYKGIPDEFKSRPGDRVTKIDGVNYPQDFQAFIHAPFSDDQGADKNNTSLALNVVLWDGKKYGQFFFFGDREYPTIKRIFEETEKHGENKGYLYWDVMLCSHHCSKAVMYWQDEGDKEPVFKKDIMAYFAKYSRDDLGYVVASAHSKFSDEPGALPPHQKAREAYEEIVQAGHFICTHEYPSKKSPEPLVFTVDQDGCKLEERRGKTVGAGAFAAAVGAAQGAGGPPAAHTGFGGDQ